MVSGRVTGQVKKLSFPALVKFFQSKSASLLIQFGVVVALPVILSRRLWWEIWYGALARGWDGTGHYSIAQIYTSSIFPDTFGRTDAYFGGMPFPNFYPPLFYWLVSLLEHTRLLSFAAAFKFVVIVPVLLMPVVLWKLGHAVSGKSRMVGMAVALASIPLLCDSRFSFILPAGLDYFSTFQIGLYTQPLGFILLVAWYISYSRPCVRGWNLALSSTLLALTILANFFNAVTATIFITTTVVVDVMRYRRSLNKSERGVERQALIVHLIVPLIALCLTVFWLIPMLSQYEYFVTRPFVADTGLFATRSFWVWYALALLGSFFWVRRHRTRSTWPYLATCLTLSAIVLFASTIAPPWFPLQSPRFLATLNFLLSVPVGYALSTAFRAFAKLLGEISSVRQPLTLRRVRYTTGTAIVLLSIFALSSPGTRWAYAFYPREGKGDIDGVLGFAREHRNGRYLVEVINPTINPAYTEASFDARAINSYLGSQGNETLSTVFHEASPNAIFTLPVTNAFSNYPDSFGISSVLADDLDFQSQPLSEHIERARRLGVKYLVIRTPLMKERIGQQSAIADKFDFGWWSVFELKDELLPHAWVLHYSPALVVSSFTLKSRRQNEWSFMRLAEEQFSDNWFDVLLVRSPESRIDRIQNLEKFGALVLDTYDYSDENVAFNRLRDFAQHRQLILLSSGASLFNRVRAARDEFPRLEVIERQAEEGPGEPLEAVRPTRHYGSSAIRLQWAAIRNALESDKIATGADIRVSSERSQNLIRLQFDGAMPAIEVPILINNTFHPNWRREDGGAVYAATPFNMVVFTSRPVTLSYGRRSLDRLGLWMSAGTILLLLVYSLTSKKQERT